MTAANSSVASVSSTTLLEDLMSTSVLGSEERRRKKSPRYNVDIQDANEVALNDREEDELDVY